MEKSSKLKVQFTEELAQQIKSKYGVKDTTLENWRELNSIPYKYVKEPKFFILNHSMVDLRILLQKKYPNESINQEFIANKLEVSRQHYNMWEIEKHEPRGYHRKRIEEFFRAELGL